VFECSHASDGNTDHRANIGTEVGAKKMEVLMPKGDKVMSLSLDGQRDMIFSNVKAENQESNSEQTTVSNLAMPRPDGENDKEFMEARALESVRAEGLALEWLPGAQRASRDVVLAAVQENGLALQFAAYSLRADREVVLTAMRNNGMALEFVAQARSADRDVVLAAIGQDPNALKFADAKLQAELSVERDTLVALRSLERTPGLGVKDIPIGLRQDRHFLLSAVHKHANVITEAPQELLDEREFVLEMVKKNPGVLEHLPSSLLRDRDFVMDVVQCNGLALRFASEDLRADGEVVLAATQQHNRAFEFAQANATDVRLEVLQKLLSSISSASAVTLRCPDDHALRRLITVYAHFVCDMCSKPVQVGHYLWGCRLCNFDMCITCSVRQETEKLSRQKEACVVREEEANKENTRLQGAPKSQDAPNARVMATASKPEDVEDAPKAEDAPNAQVMATVSKPEDVEDAPKAEDAPNVQVMATASEPEDVEDAPKAEDAPNAQVMATVSKPEDVEDAPKAEDAPNVQVMATASEPEDVEDAPKAEDAPYAQVAAGASKPEDVDEVKASDSMPDDAEDVTLAQLSTNCEEGVREASLMEEAMQAAEAAEAEKAAEAKKATEAAKAAEDEQAAEVKKATEAAEAAEDGKAAEAKKATEAEEGAEGEKAAEAKNVVEAAKAAEGAEAEQAAEAKKVAESKTAAEAKEEASPRRRSRRQEEGGEAREKEAAAVKAATEKKEMLRGRAWEGSGDQNGAQRATPSTEVRSISPVEKSGEHRQASALFKEKIAVAEQVLANTDAKPTKAKPARKAGTFGRIITWPRGQLEPLFDVGNIKRVVVLGAHHTCTNAIIREIPRFFDVSVVNKHRSDDPSIWKHKIFRRSPPQRRDTFYVAMVKDPFFWIQSLGRSPREGTFYEILPCRTRPSAGGAVVESYEEPAYMSQLFNTVVFDESVYPDAVSVWEETVRGYFSQDVLPQERTAVVRCEDFMFNFASVMNALRDRGLPMRWDAPKVLEPLDETAKDASHPNCTRRDRKELLKYYSDPSKRLLGLQSRQVDRLKRAAPRLVEALGYKGDNLSWASEE